MPKFTTKPMSVEAYQLTIDNLEEVEKWCNGSIKGIKLPIEKRVIDFYTEEVEYRVDIGDYILKLENGYFFPCTADTLNVMFIPIKES